MARKRQPKTPKVLTAVDALAVHGVSSSSVLVPSASLLCKLGSIAVHADEMLSADGHRFDVESLKTCFVDGEVRAWLAEMDRLAMIPKKRKG
jgi:hypothetical protein